MSHRIHLQGLEIPARVYLSGPMSDLPEYNYPRFNAVTGWLRALRFEVFNPAESFDGATDKTRAEYMRLDYRAILDCDALILLPDWHKSHGALREVVMAQDLGYEIFALVPDGNGWKIEPFVPIVSVVPGFAEPTHPLWIDFPYGEPSALDALKLAREDCSKERERVTTPRPLYPMGWRSGSSEEVRITDPATGGQKNSKMERIDLVPAEFLEEVGRVYGLGATKYATHNWRRGYAWSLSISAAFRHLLALSRGEDRDPEWGTHHGAHVAFHMAALYIFATEHRELDDRYHPFLQHVVVAS